jgi:DNA-binding LacI/PurR family transcriptional regulator
MEKQGVGAAGLREVAALAGVSVKTVSNVVHDYVHVSPATRERVQQAIEELRYRPNLSARNLRRGHTGLIALAVPEIDFPYFAEVANHIVREAERRGWTVLIDQTDGRADREEQVLTGLSGHLIDGVIFSPLASGRRALEARPDDLPMVLLGERVSHPSTDHVGIDNVAAAKEVVLHLAAQGRTRIAAIGAQRRRGSATARLRARGYRAGLKAAGLPVDESLLMTTASYHRADGAAAMSRLLSLRQPPDAVFCFNDLMAFGALRSLRDHHVAVPTEVALVGFDDVEECAYSTPSLTSVRPDKAAIAATAVDLLAQRISGRGVTVPQDLSVPYELVVRESSSQDRFVS